MESIMHDPLGNEMKALEHASDGAPLNNTLPIYGRVDGRGFSRFTQGMEKPFDLRMTRAMLAAARFLVERTHACAAYVQSDEISLAWQPTQAGEAFFGGKRQKMASVLAGLATAGFTRACLDCEGGLADYLDRMPHFDARVVSMPDQATTAKMFAWRGQDAKRNGLNQVAQSIFSHSELQGKTTRDVREMLAARGVSPTDYPSAGRNGTLLQRTTELRRLTAAELSRIAEAHRPSPDEMFRRGVIVHYDQVHPGLIENLESVIFSQAAPASSVREAA
jgi:tRNA(His) guanylyltransferase